MTTRITSRNFVASENLKDHVNERVDKLHQYFDGIIDAHVVLEETGDSDNPQMADITLKVFRQNLTASCKSESYEKAVDTCTDRLRRQLLRYKDKLKSKDKDYHR